MDLSVELYERCKFKVLFGKVYMIIEDFRDGMLASSPVAGASEISIVKEHCHIANPLLKIRR